MNPLKTLSSLIPPKSSCASPAPEALPPQPGLVACPPVGLSFEEVEQWQADLRQRLERLRQNPEANLGHSEELIRQAGLELQRRLLQRHLQALADAVADRCPDCQNALGDKKRRLSRSLQSMCGALCLERTYGWCPKCEHWVFPADHALGLVEHSTATPLRQEACALLVSKMPAEQAEAVSLRLTGVLLSRSTLAREGQRQGQRAERVLARQLRQPRVPAPAAPGTDRPKKPVTLVIEIDAWNIRERTDWGKTAAKRQRGEEVNRWHWVYTATCFPLEKRGVKGKERAVITERGHVATRLGIEVLMRRLHFEAQQRGLGTADRVLVVADGAVWIWKAVADRFGEAIQRLDLYHANTYLWAVATALHGEGTAAARRWVKPLLRQVRHDKVARVIQQLEQLAPRLTEAQRLKASAAVEYYRNNQARMKYLDGEQRGEPIGSGAIESTCRQHQCRMQRCGQFWSTSGDEALLDLETCWRNERWDLLFPHAKITSASQN
ncbi:MAG: ISKra4 family transposase [Limisphaerales bacterium]